MYTAGSEHCTNPVSSPARSYFRVHGSWWWRHHYLYFIRKQGEKKTPIYNYKRHCRCCRCAPRRCSPATAITTANAAATVSRNVLFLNRAWAGGLNQRRHLQQQPPPFPPLTSSSSSPHSCTAYRRLFTLACSARQAANHLPSS